MDKVRITEIAKELGMKSKDVIEKAVDLGLDVKSASSSIATDDAEKLMNYVLTGENAQHSKPSQTPHAPEVVKEVKDNDLSFLEGVRRGAFTVPGDGCIDFDPIFKVLEENGYEGYMLVEAEQDPAKANPLEYAIKARKFIREKTGL